MKLKKLQYALCALMIAGAAHSDPVTEAANSAISGSPQVRHNSPAVHPTTAALSTIRNVEKDVERACSNDTSVPAPYHLSLRAKAVGFAGFTGFCVMAAVYTHIY